MSRKDGEEMQLRFIKPLKKIPELKSRSSVQGQTAMIFDEFVASGVEVAEVPLSLSKSGGAKGLAVGLGRVIGARKLKDKYEVRQTKDGTVVWIKKK